MNPLNWTPKMVARLVNEDGMRSKRHGIYLWGDLPKDTHFLNRLKSGNPEWQQKASRHGFAAGLLVEADPPAPDLTVTLPAEVVDWVMGCCWASVNADQLQDIIRAARDAQEA